MIYAHYKQRVEEIESHRYKMLKLNIKSCFEKSFYITLYKFSFCTLVKGLKMNIKRESIFVQYVIGAFILLHINVRSISKYYIKSSFKSKLNHFKKYCIIFKKIYNLAQLYFFLDLTFN